MSAVFPFTEQERLILKTCSSVLSGYDDALATVLDNLINHLDILSQVMRRSCSIQHDLLSNEQTRKWEN